MFYCRITFEHLLLSILGPESIPWLSEIVTALESDDRIKAVVFHSAGEDFFIMHCDFRAKFEDLTSIPPGPTGLQALPDMLVRISRAPVVSIVSIRGRATRVGSELALAGDMRFAGREKAILSQWEADAGLAPRGGPIARLARFIGRRRLREVRLDADDIRGNVAKLYGCVNPAWLTRGLTRWSMRSRRGLPFSTRPPSRYTKGLVSVATPPPDAGIAPEWTAFTASLRIQPPNQASRHQWRADFTKTGDAENRLADPVGQLGSLAVIIISSPQ